MGGEEQEEEPSPLNTPLQGQKVFNGQIKPSGGQRMPVIVTSTDLVELQGLVVELWGVH